MQVLHQVERYICFFGRYGLFGILGIFIASIFTGFVIYTVLKITKQEDIKSYSNLLKNINSGHEEINKIINFVVNSFLLVSFLIMVAAFSSYIEQICAISKYISSTIFVLVCYIVFQRNLTGMVKINSILVPILLLFILFLGAKNFPNILQERIFIQEESIKIEFLVSSILYASYNSIILIPLLITMKEYIRTNRQVKLISILSSIAIVLLSLSVFLLLKDKTLVNNLEMPLAEIVKQFGNCYSYIYGFVIIASILTSAISAGYGFLENVSKGRKEYKINLILMCMTGILITKVGFSNLVKVLYPLFGFLGLLQFFYIIKTYIKPLEKKTKN